MTINEALVWMKTLRERHAELVQLRNENSARERRWHGAHADKETVREPVYDVKVLDKMVGRVAREIRMLDQQIKATNASAQVIGYTQNDDVLGELA